MYKEIKHKKEFLQMLAGKLRIDPQSLRIYIETGKLPKIHKERIEKAIEIQSKLDKKIESLTLLSFEKL